MLSWATRECVRLVVLPHLSEDIEAEASGVHHHHSEQRLQQQSHEGVHSKHQSIALHVETGCDLISDGSECTQQDNSVNHCNGGRFRFVEQSLLVLHSSLAMDSNKDSTCKTCNESLVFKKADIEFLLRPTAPAEV